MPRYNRGPLLAGSSTCNRVEHLGDDLMKLISGLFRKTEPVMPAPPTAEERVAALSTASVEVTTQTALRSDDEVLQRAARKRLAELIDAGAVDFAELLADVSNRSVVFAVAAQCKDSRRLPQALAAISDPEEVARLVVDGASSRLRQLAAETIQDSEQIRELLVRVRGKDNTVYKILKQKRDAQNAQLRQAAEVAAEANAVCALLERHGQRGFDASYAGIFAQLAARWQAVAGYPDAEVAQRVVRGAIVVAPSSRNISSSWSCKRCSGQRNRQPRQRALKQTG